MGGGVVRVRRRLGLRDFEWAVTDAPASRRWQRCSSDRAWLACRRRRWLLREAPSRPQTSRRVDVMNAFGRENSPRLTKRGENISRKGAKPQSIPFAPLRENSPRLTKRGENISRKGAKPQRIP